MTIRTIVYSFFAATTLAACSDDSHEETTSNMQKVCFADPTVDILTRSSDDISADNIQDEKVKVWGQCLGATLHNGDPDGIDQYEGNLIETPFREGEIITHNGEVWQGTKTYYYPRDTYYFRFNAFAPADALPNTDNTTGIPGLSVFCNPKTMSFTGDGGTIATYGITGIPVVQEINSSTKAYDLLVPSRFLSAPKTDGTDRTPISFQFKHILSRLSIYLYTSHIDNNEYTYDVRVKSVKAYLPNNETFTAMHDQCANNVSPTTATTQSNGTVLANADKWGWNCSGIDGYSAFEDVSVLNKTNFTVENDLNPTYKEYLVMEDADGLSLSQYANAAAAQSANLPVIGKEYLLAPTPTFTTGQYTKPQQYHYYLKIQWCATRTPTSGGAPETTNDYYKIINLYDQGMPRILQGKSNKLYINITRSTWQ